MTPVDPRGISRGWIDAEWLPEEEMLDSVAHEIALSDLPDAFAQILQGRMRGRAVVDLSR
ncbi:hypothetical protein [Paenibacillus sp. XY044]|uniref:hypothetical protein n=1 Tax=Paenibacillus sp. XY044 TaxID=2026089 RepID=UPI000B97EB2F|nr:hypothetical protein [Paenibacillus sp. XY044]OZB91269.1 hypothetical protein CJP46_28670 [Paenibacillus sp. XY044]